LKAPVADPKPFLTCQRALPILDNADQNLAMRTLDRRIPAFTVIELLVVIAIVGILAAILLPTLSNAKAKAIRIQCMNNIKQFTLAMHLYAGDNFDVPTDPNWNAPFKLPDGSPRPGWCYTAGSGDILNTLLWPTNGQSWPYLTGAAVYRCPLDRTNANYWSLRKQKITTYIQNGALVGYNGNTWLRPFKLSRFKQDAIIVWQGREDNPGDFNDASSTPSEGISKAHEDGTTVGVVDGHVEYIKLTTFYALATQNPGRLWCTPK
jgi:prepilin-type N-terminal cleavage/methylation domain-containing protein